MSGNMVELSDGRTVPSCAVDALHIFDATWPGASWPAARAGIVAAVLDALKANGYAVVELPEPEARGVTGQYEWPVPITCTLTGGLHTGSRGGAVFIRRSDGRIALDGIATPLPNAADARRTAAALLAAAAAAERDSEGGE